MDRRGGSVIRTLAHQLLAPAECTILKSSLKEFRQNASVPMLITSLKPVINTTEKMLLLAEISFIMPSRLKDDFNKLCALHFTGYRHVLMSCNPDFRSESPLEVIAQNTSGSVQIVSSPSQKKLLVSQSRLKEFQAHNMSDIRLDDVHNNTKVANEIGKSQTLPPHSTSRAENAAVSSKTLVGHTHTLPTYKTCKSLERNTHQLIKHLAHEQMANDNHSQHGEIPNKEKVKVQSEPSSSHTKPAVLHRGETDMIVMRCDGRQRRLPSVSDGNSESPRDTEFGSQHSGENPVVVSEEAPREARRRRKIRKVELAREEGVSLGLSIRGNAKTGIFVSDVDIGSQADVQGLRVGDKILKVNNVSLKDFTHHQAAQVIRDNQQMVLYVTSSQSHKMPAGADERAPTPAEKAVTIRADPDGWLGCSIRGGTDYQMGVAISNVDPMSPAQRAGLHKRDVILQMNGVDVAGLTHMQVVTLATSTPELELVIKPASRSIRAGSLGDEVQKHRRPVARHNSTPNRPMEAPPTPPSSPLRWMRPEDLRRFEEELQRTPPRTSSTPMPPHTSGDLPVYVPPPDYASDATSTNEQSTWDNNAVQNQIKEDEKLARMLSGTLRNNMLHSTVEDQPDKFVEIKAANTPTKEDVRNIFNAQYTSPRSGEHRSMPSTPAKRNLANEFGSPRSSGKITDLQQELSRESQKMASSQRQGDVVLQLKSTPDMTKYNSRHRSQSPGDRRSLDPRRRSRSQSRVTGSPAVFDAYSSPKYVITQVTPSRSGRSRDKALGGAISRIHERQHKAMQYVIQTAHQDSDDDWML